MSGCVLFFCKSGSGPEPDENLFMAQVDTFAQLQVARDSEGGFFELLRNELEVVCPAFDENRQRMVALHVLHAYDNAGPEREAFFRQAKRATSVRHPCLTAVFDFGEDEGACFHISEHVDGENLEHYLERCAPLPERIAMQLVRDAAAGLSACADAPSVLAGLDLMQSTVVLHGRTTASFSLKVGGYSFGSEKAEKLPVAGVHAFYLRALGELLVWATIGEQLGLDELQADDRARLPSSAGRFLDNLSGEKPAVRTLDAAAQLTQEVLELVADNSDVKALPETLVPRLPLRTWLPSIDSLQEYLGPDYPLKGDPYDAREPLRVSTFDSEQNQEGTLQLLPLDTQMLPDKVGALLQSAQGRGNALDQPHVVRLLAYWPTENAGFFIEEDAGDLSLEEVTQLRGVLLPEETLLVLNQLESACAQAASLGLSAVLRGEAQITIRWVDHRRGEVPDFALLADTPIAEWPEFRVRVRTFPTFLSLLRHPPELVQAHRSNNQDAIDFAWLARCLLMGNRDSLDHVNPKIAVLIDDVLTGREGAMIRTGSEFLRGLRPLVETRDDYGNDHAKNEEKRTPASGIASAIRNQVSVEREDQVETEFDEELEEAQPPLQPGLAEVLFGQQAGPDDEPSQPNVIGLSHSMGGQQQPVSGFDQSRGQKMLGDNANAKAEDDAIIGYEFSAGSGRRVNADSEDGEDAGTGSLWLIIVVVVIAILLAAVFAQLSGQAFWLK